MARHDSHTVSRVFVRKWKCFACMATVCLDERNKAFLICREGNTINIIRGNECKIDPYQFYKVRVVYPIHAYCALVIRECFYGDMRAVQWVLALTSEPTFPQPSGFEEDSIYTSSSGFFDLLASIPESTTELIAEASIEPLREPKKIEDKVDNMRRRIRNDLLSSWKNCGNELVIRVAMLPSHLQTLIASHVQSCQTYSVLACTSNILSILDHIIGIAPSQRLPTESSCQQIIDTHRLSRTFFFAGRRYILSGTSKCNASQTSQDMKDANRDAARSICYVVSLDALGCRAITTLPPKAAIQRAPWYRTFSRSPADRLLGETMGMTLRDLYPENLHTFPESCLWDTPTPPVIQPEHVYPLEDMPKCPRMHTLVLPLDLSAISVGYYESSSTCLRLYRQNRSVCKYDTTIEEENMVYLYFALWHGEKLRKIFVRKGNGTSDGECLVVWTSYARTFCFGHYVPPHLRGGYQFVEVFDFNKANATMLCMNDRYLTDRMVFAVASAQSSQKDTFTESGTPQFWPTYNYSIHPPTPNWGDIAIEANLDGLLSFRCRFVSTAKEMFVLGVLFKTRRGEIAVGQWHWDDRVSEPYDSQQGLSMMNAVSEKDGRIVAVRQGTEEIEGQAWEIVKTGSQVTWWIGSSGNRIQVL